MAQPAWQVILKNKAGSRVALFSDQEILSLGIHKRVNKVGTYEFTIDATVDDRCDLFAVDGQVEIMRRIPGYDWYTEFEGFHRTAIFTTDTQGRQTFSSSGVDYKDLLARRIIAEYTGSSGGAKSGAAETVAKAFVTEQIGSSAPAADQVSGFTVEADGADGNSIAIARAYRNLLEVCQEIAAIGGGDFDVVGNGDAQWQFKWYDGQLGTDRRSTIVFATGFGNMLSPRLVQYPATSNYVLVAGQGEGTDRTWVTRPASGAPTGIDRRTVFRDARDTSDTSTQQARGDAELDAGKAVNELTFSVIQTERYQYGQHYYLGDLVTARYRNTSYDLKIVGVHIMIGNPDQIMLEFQSA